MSFVESPSGWHLPGIAATATVHAVLLAVAALAFRVPDPTAGEAAALRAVTFALPALPEPPGAQDAKLPRDDPESPRAPPASLPRQTRVTEAAPPAAPLPSAQRPAAHSTTPAPPPAPSTAVPAPARNTSDTEPDLLAAYSQQLRERILERRPRGLRKEGTVIVAFSLDRSGRISKAGLAQSSGDVQLDRLALRMVRQASPFLPPAPTIPASELTFAIPIRFH